jgi:Fe-S-cluster-containing dehydrogenase component
MMDPIHEGATSEPALPRPPDGSSAAVSRRTFLKAGLTGGLLVAVGGSWIPLQQALAQAQSEYVMIIDLNKCVGCRACELACQQRNNLPEGKSYIRILPKGDEENRWFLPIQCQHCRNAPCEHVCPTMATYHHKSGVVLINEKTCVGCKYCAVACPYDARAFDHKTGLVDKCWLCLDWVLGGGLPACVQSCVLGARIFGRRDDPEIAALLASGRPQPLHPELGTDPGILYYIFPGS